MTTPSMASQLTGTTNWLQLFASPVGGGQAAPAPAATSTPSVITPGATPVTPQPVLGQHTNLQAQPLAVTQPTPAAAPEQTPAALAVEPELLDFGGRRVPKTAEMAAVHADWQRQQAALTKAQQDSLRFQQMYTQAQAGQPHPGQAPAQTQAAAVAQALSESELADMFIEHPSEAVQRVVGPILEQLKASILQQVQPIQNSLQTMQQQNAMNEQLSGLATRYPDFDAMIPAISDLITKQPELASLPNGLEIAYQVAKSATVQAPKTIQEMLADPATRQQILADPALRTQILQENLRAVAGSTPPPVIGATPGAVLPTMPAQSPGTIRDAKTAFLARMALGRAGQ